MEPTLQTESYRLVFKRFGALITVAVLLLTACLAGNFYAFAKLNEDKEGFNHALIPLPPELPDDGQGPSQQQGAVLAETQPVGQDYFSDTLFIGDSITTGLNSMGGEIFGDKVAVVAALGLNTHTARTNAFYRHPGAPSSMTAVEAVVYHRPRKVYILLGTNGLEYESIDWNIEGFNSLITEIRTNLPGVFIVIQSLIPVTAKVAARRTRFARENIDEYNRKLLVLSLQKGVFYLDLCAAMSDEEGNLRMDVEGGDGMHLNRKGYQVWYDCIVSHAVQGASSYVLDADGRLVYRPQAAEGETETQ